MSDTRIILESGAVAAYVARVRESLADLPAEDADDLTQGMEADLSEALSEVAGDLTSRFGTPEAYAAELRSAAGLPPAVAEGPPRRSLSARLTAAEEGWAERHPTPARLGRDLALLWWLGRGLGAALVLSAFLGIGRVPATVLFVVASLYLGLQAREGSSKAAWPRTLDRLWNLGGLVFVPLAAVLVLSLATAGFGGGFSAGPAAAEPYRAPGVLLDGSTVDGIYAYGADGKRLDDVRLFASDGRPIILDSFVGSTTWVDQAGRQWSNVFPGESQSGQGWTVSDPGAWHPPMAIDPLVRQVPTGVDPSMVPSGAEGAPTSATPTGATTPATAPTSPPTTPSGRATAPKKPSTTGSPSASR